MNPEEAETVLDQFQEIVALLASGADNRPLVLLLGTTGVLSGVYRHTDYPIYWNAVARGEGFVAMRAQMADYIRRMRR